MLDVRKIKDVVKMLLKTKLKKVEDNYNSIVILHKKNDTLKSYEIIVQYDEEEFRNKEVYIREIDVYTEDTNKDFNIYENDLYVLNEDVVVISNVRYFD